MSASATDALTELDRMGQSLGGFSFVQGPGGNVSVKADGELFVKASGVRLREVATEKGHARVPLEIATLALHGDADADKAVFARAPRPSLETYFHALPGRVIAHTHALGVLLYACAESRESRPARVTGEVAYARPGRGIALAMEGVLTKDAVQAIVLSSHGLVVIAESAELAIERTVRIEQDVRARFGALPSDAELVARYMDEPSRSVDGGVVRSLPARAPSWSAAVPPRYLFPDVVICASTFPVRALTDIESLAARSIATSAGRAHVLADDGGGRVLVAKSAAQLDQSTEVIAAHDWLEDALRAHATPRYLPDDEPAKLLDLPSEQYRIRLAGGQS